MYTGNRKKEEKKKIQVLNCINYQIAIFSGTDMIKIWNWFKAIGSFVRKIKEKNTSAELSWCRNVSHRCRIVRVPKCLTQVPKCPGAELSRCRSVQHSVMIYYSFIDMYLLLWSIDLPKNTTKHPKTYKNTPKHIKKPPKNTS